MNFLTSVENLVGEGLLSEKLLAIVEDFYKNYKLASKESDYSEDQVEELFSSLADLLREQLVNPYSFELYHKRIKEPFDHYSFGLDFLRPLVDFSLSYVYRLGLVDKMIEQLKRGENVVLFANHQTEADPQLISLLLEKTHPTFAEEIIWVAGERVLLDPLATPFSMGRNLLCIYSKKHIDYPVELKSEKQRHNIKTMEVMRELLKEGGHCIYVAPSGGRDRCNAAGEVEVAPFVGRSIEMFRLMAERAVTPTHFYPMALDTYDLLPPPQRVGGELGEQRKTVRSGIKIAFGEEIAFSDILLESSLSRDEKREERAGRFWRVVNEDYHLLKNNSSCP